MNGRESKSNISKGHSLPTRIPNRLFAAAVFCGALMVLSGTARATIVETDGKRVLFTVEAWDEVEKIVEGRHERFIVGNLARFLERAMAKGKPAR